MSTQRIALVIGNAEYTGSNPLKNPVNDAALLTRRLKSLGFEIVGGCSTPDMENQGHDAGRDLTTANMTALIATFMAKVERGATAVVYYGGHGCQVGGKNYLVPVDTTLDPAMPDLGLVEIKPRLETLADRVGVEGALVVFLDACRDDSFTNEQRLRLLKLLDEERKPEFGQDARSLARTAPTGLSTFKLPRDGSGRTFIGFATAPGDVAMDGKGSNSAFALALDRHLATRGLEIEELYDRLALDVTDQVAFENKGKAQDPWSETNLNRRLFLHPRSIWPIFALGFGGLLAGIVICRMIFENGRLVDPTGRPEVWALGLVFGAVIAAGTWFWGSGTWRDTFFAFVGPGFGFALALAMFKLLPSMQGSGVKFSAPATAELAHFVFNAVTFGGGALYLVGTGLVWLANPPDWPRNFLQWLNRILTLLLPVIIVLALYRLQFYIDNANPVQLVTAMFAVLGGVVYAISVALSCRGQRGNFSQFGPMTGAITVGLLMPAIFAAYQTIIGRNDLTHDATLLVVLGAVWHMLLGAQLGYCFTFYVPEHQRLRDKLKTQA